MSNSSCSVVAFNRDAAESTVPSTTGRNAVSSSYCFFRWLEPFCFTNIIVDYGSI